MLFLLKKQLAEIYFFIFLFFVTTTIFKCSSQSKGQCRPHLGFLLHLGYLFLSFVTRREKKKHKEGYTCTMRLTMKRGKSTKVQHTLWKQRWFHFSWVIFSAGMKVASHLAWKSECDFSSAAALSAFHAVCAKDVYEEEGRSGSDLLLRIYLQTSFLFLYVLQRVVTILAFISSFLDYHEQNRSITYNSDLHYAFTLHKTTWLLLEKMCHEVFTLKCESCQKISKKK